MSKTMDKFNLRPQWKALLEIYGEFAKICERHGLRWWVTGGTQLGAVRHQGFIPWDDDMDVLLPVEDYDRFIKYAYEELPSHLKIVSQFNTPEFDLPFAKVQDCRKNRTDQIRRESGLPLNEGLYIDVFCYVGQPEDKGWRRLQSVYYHLRYAGAGRLGNFSLKRLVVWSIGRFLYLFVPGPRTRFEFALKWHRLARRFGFDETGRVNLFDSHSFDYNDANVKTHRVGYRAEWFKETKVVPFEDIQVPISADYDKWLSVQYGDYMQLPPEEKRFCKHECESPKAWMYGPTTDRKPYPEEEPFD